MCLLIIELVIINPQLRCLDYSLRWLKDCTKETSMLLGYLRIGVLITVTRMGVGILIGC